MAFVPGYEYDVCVSGAGVNADGPDAVSDVWLRKLAADIQRVLTAKPGLDFDVWVDTGGAPEEPVSSEAEQHVRRSATLLVVLSRDYLESTRCGIVLESFLEGACDRPRPDTRVFLVDRESIPRRDRPPKLYPFRSFRFWDIRGAGEQPRTLDRSSVDEGSLRYWAELDRLCRKLGAELRRLKTAEARADPAKRLEKPDRSRFDVFLCHNSKDKPAVKGIGERLRERGLRPWLDEWELRPGTKWQRVLEEQIGSIDSAAVFVGKSGTGPWQDEEMYAFVRQFVNRKCQVIPVILEDVQSRPELPVSLEGMTWVDFRRPAPDPLQQLVWGITGEKPDWRPGVFLAEVTDDLYWLRADVAQCLDQAGFRVLPDDTLYPEDPGGFREDVDQDLAPCRIFVQLLSDRTDSPGLPRGFLAMQYERALSQDKRILLWRSPELKLAAVEDEDHRELLKRADAMRLEDFKKYVKQAAQQADDAPVSPTRATPLVHISVKTDDTRFAERVGESLRERDIYFYTDTHELAQVFQHFHGMLLLYDRDHIVPARFLLKDCMQYIFDPRRPEVGVCKAPPPDGPAALGVWLPEMHTIDESTGFDAAKLDAFVTAVRKRAALAAPAAMAGGA